MAAMYQRAAAASFRGEVPTGQHYVHGSIQVHGRFQGNALDVCDFLHRSINHSKLFADRHNHINGIENFWNQSKINIAFMGD